MRIVQSFGIIFTHGTTVREADLKHEELSKACELGFKAISGSQAKIDQAFMHIQNRSDSSNPGFYTDFGMFARFCTRVSCDKRYQALIDVVTKFAFENYPMAKGELLYGRKCPSRVWHNCSSAANEYGFSPSRMTAIVDALTGFRHEASLRPLTWQQVDLIKGTVTFGRLKRQEDERTIVLSDETLRLFEQLWAIRVDGCDWVFPSRRLVGDRRGHLDVLDRLPLTSAGDLRHLFCG